MQKSFRAILVSLAAVLAALSVAAVAPNSTQARGLAPSAITKTCSAGYRHAVIGGAQKCLRAGEFCAHRYDRQYRRYGYRCTRYYANVARYRLTYA